MKNVLTLSLIAAATIQAAEPMVPGSMSTDRGGVKSAIDAYSDGGGAYLYDEKGRAIFNNDPMNKLVFKYGQSAKDSGINLKDQIKTVAPSTEDEKILADAIPASNSIISASNIIDGMSCDDGNLQTINDVYINGVCSGRSPYNCFEIYSNGARANGNYGIDFKRNGSLYTTYCDMTNGGWTLLYSFSSSSSDTNLQGYYGGSIDSITELSAAGITTYNTNYNYTGYTIKSGYLQFYYSSTPIGYLTIPLPKASASNTVKVDWGNWHTGTSELYKVSGGITTLIEQISSNSGAYSTSFSYTAGDSVKLTETSVSITWVSKIWVK